MHSTLSHALKRISTKYFQKAKMYALNGEPPCDCFLDRVQGVQVPDDDPAILAQHSRRNPMGREEQTLDSLEPLTQSLLISQLPLPLQKTSKIINPEEQLMQGRRPRQESAASGFKSIKPTDFSLEWRRVED
jgi:hypothetical protein